MKPNTWNVEKLVPILITGGFFVHLINVSRHYIYGTSHVGEVLMWPVDVPLAVLMAYCAVALIVRWRAVFAAFDVSSTVRKIGYWAITFYVTASAPGHVLFLSTGNTSYFDVFPWWFSLVIMPVYLLIIAYFITLKSRGALAATGAHA